MDAVLETYVIMYHNLFGDNKVHCLKPLHFNHFLLRQDVPDENTGLSSRGRLMPRAGGLGGRPSSLFKPDVGGLGTFAEVEGFLLAPSGLLIRFDE